jgi:hypothetical protein
VDDRPRGELPVGDGVGELGASHPAVRVDRISTHQRDDHEASAVAQRADLQRRPGQRGERCRARERDRPGVDGEPAPPAQLGEPAGEQHRDDAGTEEHRRCRAGGEIEQCAPPANARTPERDARGRDHRHDRRGRPRPDRADPQRR